MTRYAPRVKRFLLVAACLLAAACGTSSPATTSAPTTTTTSSSDDEKAIHAAFETFQKAAATKDGDTAVSVLTSKSFSVYDDIRKIALTGTEQEVASLVPSARLLAYTMRGDIDPPTLRGASPKDLASAAIELGLVSSDSVNNITVNDLTIHDGKALGKVLVVRAQTTDFLSFLREEGSWRFHSPSLFDVTDSMLGAVAKQRNLTHDQLIEQTLVAKYGHAKTAELHKPIGA